MRALAKTGLGRRCDTVTARTQNVGDPRPAPATVPDTVHKNEGLLIHQVTFATVLPVIPQLPMPVRNHEAV